jgi:hypothetical protein
MWGNAGGQLSGLLMYDLVIIWPLLLHISSVDPNLILNLIIYIVVLVSSGATSIYYLFINPATRLLRTRSESAVAASM